MSLCERASLIIAFEGGLRIKEFNGFEQWTSVFRDLKTPGSEQTETSKPDFRNNLVEFCKDPAERVKMGSTPNPGSTSESESLPSRVWNILLGSVP